MNDHLPKTSDDEKIDLKHDTMPFADEGEEQTLDGLDAIAEDEAEVTAEELFKLEADDQQSQDAALETVEADRVDDVDNLPEEDWVDDLPDEVPPEENDETAFQKK